DEIYKNLLPENAAIEVQALANGLRTNLAVMTLPPGLGLTTAARALQDYNNGLLDEPLRMDIDGAMLTVGVGSIERIEALPSTKQPGRREDEEENGHPSKRRRIDEPSATGPALPSQFDQPGGDIPPLWATKPAAPADSALVELFRGPRLTQLWRGQPLALV